MKIPLTSIDSEFTVNAQEPEFIEFVESIKEQGLMHPITVRQSNTFGRYQLITGAKRLEAGKILGWPEIDAEVKEATDKEAMIMRVHENLHRHNLPWHEQVVLVEQLHSLRQEQFGKPSGGRPKSTGDGKGWGIRDTAQELGIAIGPLSEDLNLARAVAFDPALKNVKDKKTAVRLVKLQAQRIQSENEAGLPISIEANQAFLGDSASILKQFPSLTFDGCISDPPWIKFFDPKYRIDERTLPVLKEVFRVLKYNTMMYLFIGFDDLVYYAGYDQYQQDGTLLHIKGELEKIGFSVAKTPIFWKKGKALSRRGVKAWEYDRDFEVILVAAKGTPVLTSSTRKSAIKEFDAVPPVSLIHPNEKPVKLIEDILADCSYEGNLILDPFAGSFVTAKACKNMKRRFIVCERDQEAYRKGCKRIGQEISGADVSDNGDDQSEQREGAASSGS